MRRPRLVIAVAFFVTTVFFTFVSLRSSHPPRKTLSTESTSPGIRSYFSIRAPFSIFPPHAIITLTHENSTAFLARPAAFGPVLPTEGLKGQVWIGSGFGDEPGVEGEVGCSDVLGLADGYIKSGAGASEGVNSGDAKFATTGAKFRRSAQNEDGPFTGRAFALWSHSIEGSETSRPRADDGTDDYLHYPLQGSALSKYPDLHPVDTNHADIQSIQEGAEINGKVVLLSRGGCGFLEKVKWAQRRGAVALIVGDDTKGGPLIQMYARGDTSNVTIPSIFTSRMTAHLLASLIGSEGLFVGSMDKKVNPTLKVQHGKKTEKSKKKQISRPTFTPAVAMPAVTATAGVKAQTNKSPKLVQDESTVTTSDRPGWLKSVFRGSSSPDAKSKTEKSRPPSSGRLDWVLVDNWKDDDSVKKSSTKLGKEIKQSASQKSKPDDDFVIGVHDWRDPDLVETKETSEVKGSGEYGKHTAKTSDTQVGTEEEHPSSTGSHSKGLMDAIFGDDEEGLTLPIEAVSENDDAEDGDDEEEYDGLWVTLTPTNGASPFLDTLLVLVISPLVTLTVVYALLLIRSRIRRQRWRAPKSVVERLPVRTYQTIATPGNQSPRLPSPTSSSSSTPLLQRSHPARPRPRSRTSTGVPETGTEPNTLPVQMPSLPRRNHEHEKNASVSSEWKKFMGKQVECVVCLEEYVDGVSRVMSLPCGHEFHADCITPWLTTRRRTCPICKGDVVRSLARGSASSPRYDAYRDNHNSNDTDDEEDEDNANHAPETTTSQSASALPIPHNNTSEDLEQGVVVSPRPRPGSWRSLLSRSPQPPPEDRDR